MTRSFVALVFCFIQTLLVVGQESRMDSLELALEKTDEPRQRVDLLIKLAVLNYDYQSEKAYGFASEAYDIARSSGYFEGERRALTYKGFYFYSKGDYSTALQYYRQSSHVALPRDKDFGYNLVMTGNVFRSVAQYDSAIFYYRSAIDLFTEQKAESMLPFAYKNLARLFVLTWNNKEARLFFEKALEIYNRQGSRGRVADTWFSLSEVSRNESNFGEAARYIEDGCNIANELNDDYLKIHCLMHQANMKYRLGEYAESLKFSFEALGILKSKDFPLLLSNLYLSIGDVYRALGDNDVAMRYLEEALKITDKIGIKYETARVYSSLAAISRDGGKFEEAHQYVDKSVSLRTEIGDEQGLSFSYSVRGQIHFREKNYDEAIRWMERSLSIRRAFDNKEGISSSLFNLSTVYAARNEMKKALDLQMEALALEKTLGNPFYIGFSHNRLGSMYTKLGVFPKALEHLTKAAQIAVDAKSNSLYMNNERNWSEYFEIRGDQTRAFAHYKNYIAARDSLYSDIGGQKLAELQALYIVQQKDQEINLLNRERAFQDNEIKLQRARIDQQTIIIVSIVVGLMLVSIMAFITYRYNIRMRKAHREITEQKEEIQSQSEELMEANSTIADINRELAQKIEARTLALTQAYKELDTFFYRASHDFRRPLTTFLGLSEVAKITIRDPNALELFDKVRETAVNLDKMLIKLQSISDVGSQELIFKEVLLKEIFDNVCDGFRDDLQRRNIKTTCEVKLDQAFVSYPAMVKTIIENLVENAIHFGGVEHPYIRLRAVNSGQYVTIDIQDNGQGIAREYHARVFDMYFRASERSKGNGLGLYIVRKAVEKLQGSITLSSIVGRGSTFTVMLPNNA